MGRASTYLLTLVISIVFSQMTWPGAAHAGPYTDDLSRCIVQGTTAGDKELLIRWLFTAASLHPSLKSLVTTQPSQLDASNKLVAELLMKLLTDTCRPQADKAIRYEGQAAIQQALQVFGQVAGREMFSSPEVAAGMASFATYLDQQKLKSLGQQTQ